MSYSLLILPSVLEELIQVLHERNRFGSGRDLLTELVAVFGKIR